MLNQLSISARRIQNSVNLICFPLLTMDPYAYYDFVERAFISNIDEWTTHPCFPKSVFAVFFLGNTVLRAERLSAITW